MTRILVAQLGARMHYAVPRILHEAGMLSMFHTDICAVKGWPAVARRLIPRGWQPRGLQRLTGRVPKMVPAEKIQAYTSFGWEYAQRRRTAKSHEETTTVHLWAGETFNRLVIDHGLGNAEAVYTYNSAGLELLREVKRRGLRTIMEQTIAPRVIELEILEGEFARYPEFRDMVESEDSWRRFADREAAEWELADVILCGSQFVVDGIRSAGGPADKTVVVPYGIDITQFTPPVRKPPNDKSLHVLFVGEVGIRKGAHYLIEAARLVEKNHPAIQFRLVGAIALPASVLSTLPANVQLTGLVPRTEVRDQFAWADVFCLPSLCEGSATVTYEALAMGLPVICTPNTGSVVRDGLDGLIVPAQTAEKIANILPELAKGNSALFEKIRSGAVSNTASISIESYGIRLVESIMAGCRIERKQ